MFLSSHLGASLITDVVTILLTSLDFGLSASAAEAYGFTLVRPSVRSSVTPYPENSASDFDDFFHKATS